MTIKINKIYLTIFLLTSILNYSCQDSSTSINNETPKQTKTEELNIDLDSTSIKREYYLSQMKQKNYRLQKHGHCGDALEDNLHKSFTAYVDSTIQVDESKNIFFKFKDVCCQEYLGDYQINNDTLKFVFEQVNEEACDCICWYHYKLTINDLKQNFNAVVITGKK